MSEKILLNRHSFHYLDAWMQPESVSVLDNFFLELDVMTHVVEGSAKRMAARGGYHILRGVAIAVQMIAYGIFMTIKYIGLGCYYGAKLAAKGLIALFIDMPLAAQRKFFPTSADLHEKRVKICQKALKGKNLSIEHIVGSQEERHSYSAQRELMQTLIVQPLKSHLEDTSTWKECCSLMEEIADGSLSTQEIDKKEESILSILNEGKERPILHLDHLVKTFSQAFRSEKEFENTLTIEMIKQSPDLLFKYPRLLLRKDVEEIVKSSPEEVKIRLLHTRRTILYRFTQRAHQKESRLLNTFPHLLKKINLSELKNTHTSLEEEQFLAKRLEVLNKRIAELEHTERNNGFECAFLQFERHHIEKQLKKMKENHTYIKTLEGNRGRVQETNWMHEKCMDDLCTALKARIQTTLESVNFQRYSANHEIVKLKNSLQEGLKKLEKLTSSEKKLTALRAMVTELHIVEKLIVNMGGGGIADLDSIKKSVISYRKLHEHLELAHSIEEWQAFGNLTTPQQRNEERLEALSHDLVCMLLETKAECQMPLLLAKEDTRTRQQMQAPLHKEELPARSIAYQKIEKASKDFVARVSKNAFATIQKELMSITEFRSVVQDGKEFKILNANNELQKEEECESLNFKALANDLQTAESLGKWYASLQEIWIQHMPRQQEEMLLATSGSQRQNKMAEAFEHWFEITTGGPLGVRLTFNHLTVPNRSKKRKEAVEVLKANRATLGKVLQKKEAKKTLDPVKKTNSFAPDLMMHEEKAHELTAVQYAIEPVEMDSREFPDIISGLEQIKAEMDNPPNPGLVLVGDMERKIGWTIALHNYAETNQCHLLRWMVLEGCKEVISESFIQHQAIPSQIQNIFLKLHSVHEREGIIDFGNMYNVERGEFLAYLLKSLFAVGNKIDLTEEHVARLQQMCSLAFLRKEEVEAILQCVQSVPVDPSTPISNLLMLVSQQLQDSSIGLEGIPAESVLRAFHESGMPVNEESRRLLDSYMSQGTEALSFYLLPYVDKEHAKQMDHHQAREAIARALIHAYRIYPEQTRDYILKKIQENQGNLSYNRLNLAPPLYIFYSDLLLQLDPATYLMNSEIIKNTEEYTATLLANPEINHLLMGYARKISNLIYSIHYLTTIKVDCGALIQELLKSKIAYQILKKNEFEGKRAITDFLKIEVHLAESLMMKVHSIVQSYLSDPANEAAIKNSLHTLVSSATNAVEQSISKEIGNFPSFKSTQIEGFFTLNAGLFIDVSTGIMYRDGQQKIDLPTHLQNHPTIRTLGIQDYPYVWDSGTKSYIYYIQKHPGKNHPNLIIKNVNDKPIIQKELPVTFEGDRTAYLQFIPKENIQLPTAVMNRMNIDQFWAKDSKIYGYDHEGKLIVIVKKRHPSAAYNNEDKLLSISNDSIHIASEEKFFFLPNLAKDKIGSVPLLNLLSKNFNLNEVLINEDLSLYYIPALGLKISKREDGHGQEEWVCSFNGSEEKILLLEGDSPAIAMKNKVDPKKWQEANRALEEALYRRGLFRADDPSLKEDLNRKKLDQAVEQQQNKLSALEQRQFMITCFDEANQIEAVFFDQAPDGSAKTRDLTGALALTLNQLDAVQPNYPFLIEQLAQYPLQGPLTPTQLSLIKRAIAKMGDEPPVELQAYLLFLNYQHTLFKVREAAVTPQSDNKERREVESAFQSALKECQLIIGQFGTKKLSNELLALWRKTGVYSNHPLLAEEGSKPSQIKKRINPKLVIELQVSGSKSTLENIGAQKLIVASPKDYKKELSTHQKELSLAFKDTSFNQVSGFYFEKMGYFSIRELYADFKLDRKGRALYGLRQKDLDAIFDFLQEEKIITKSPLSLYWRITSPECAQRAFLFNQLRARLSLLSLSGQDLQRCIARLQGFLFRAMQSGFDFSIKEGREPSIDLKLSHEKEMHLQKYLEAEVLLNEELPKYRATLTDLKYAYLTGDYAQFLSPKGDNHQAIARLSNALTRFLFHKTEMQHIENIQKAPTKGERNKIQLLQTKRNYSVDLLLQEGLTDEKRDEQIMQRAYLTFEEDYGNRCNLMQIRMFRSLMLGKNSLESIDAIQARMGFGKTALLPLLAIVRIAMERKEPVEKRHLVRYIVPRAVLEDNTSSFNQRLSSIIGRHVIQDLDFTRYQINKDNPEESFKLMIIDLEARLHFYKEVRKEGNVLIQPPEVRCSMEAQDLDFTEMLRTNLLSSKARRRCLKAKRLLVEMRSMPTYNVFDELDDTQDFRSREVNFTRGNKLAIPKEMILPLERLVTYIEEHKNEEWGNKKERAKAMVEALCTDRNKQPIAECNDPIAAYLADPTIPINEETKAILSAQLVNTLTDPQAQQTENDVLFFLIRMVLQDEFILSLIRSKQPNTHYGVRFTIDPESGERHYSYDPDTRSALLISVPYEGVNTPKGLSVFDNREVAAITTLRYYFSNETSFAINPHLDFLIKQIKENSLPFELIQHYLPGNEASEHPAVVLLRKMSRMLDQKELKKAKDEFFNQYMNTPTREFRKFFGMAVTATQIRSDEGCLKSDRYEQGSLDDISLGCSGTVGETSSYFTNQAPDPAADGMLSLEIMGRESNSTIEWLEPPKADEDYLPEIIETLLDHTKPTTRAIADIAGICKSRDGTPETVVEELWRQLKGKEEFADIEGIIYYGKDNVKRLFRGGEEALVCTTEMEIEAIQEGRKYFSFYKQKNCRGSDIKQAHGAHCLVTMDENVSNSDAKQTILRFRNIVTQESQQSFSFAAMPEYRQIVIESLKNEIETENLSLQAKHIAYYLRLQERNAEERNALTLFKKEMKAHIKVAAGHLEAQLLCQLPKRLSKDQRKAYIKFLEVRNGLSPLVERSLNSLYAKYGTATQTMDRDIFIKSVVGPTKLAINQLFGAASDFAHSCGLENITIERQVYEKRINKSVKAFKLRYPKNKSVQTSSAQSEGQNVAQAQAQALAEAVTETLTENLLETQVPLTTPHLRMPKKLPGPISFDFLTDEGLLGEIEEIHGLKNSIEPSYRGYFFVSPGIEKEKQISHYALVDQSETRSIFITQSEAEAFKKEKERLYVLGEDHLTRSPFNNFNLVDLRETKRVVDSTPMQTELKGKVVAQLSCVALGNNDIPQNFKALNTDDIRKIKLINAEAHQLVPQMSVTYSDPATKGFIEPHAFGLSQDLNFNITFNPTPNQFPIEVSIQGAKNVAVTLPLDNEIFIDAVNTVYKDPTLNKKTEKVHQIVDEKCQLVLPKLRALEAKEKELALITEENRKTIANVGNFKLNDSMKQGLLERDADGYSLSKPDLFYQYTTGKDAIQLCNEIVVLQQKIKNSLNHDDLQELITKFEQLVPSHIQEKFKRTDFDYTKDFLFTQIEWNKKLKIIKTISDADKKFDQVSVIERIYGRIVYSVHDGVIEGAFGAKKCTKDDCRQMFASVIPGLISVVPTLQAAVVKIEQNEPQRMQIQKEIEEMKQQLAPWLNALKSAEELLKAQTEIEKTFNQCGYHLPNGEFFDQFHFENLAATPKTKATVTFKATLPNYRHTVQEDMAHYAQTFKGLTPEEMHNLNKNQAFLQHILTLSAKIENRENEIRTL